jgi:ABC-type multidrug transport system ATPase subunit
VELVAEGVEVIGSHGPLLQPTSLRAREGRVLVVSGDPNSGRTALALVLAGRLHPSKGTVRWNGSERASALRRSVGVVDAPEITEPEGSVSVRDVVAEGLSLASRWSGRRRVRTWLDDHDFAGHVGERFENLDGLTRTRLLLELSAENRATQVLVLDCPDRHGGDPRGWYELAQRQAERGKAVVALCDPHSAEKLDPAHAHVSSQNQHLTDADLTAQDTTEDA